MFCCRDRERGAMYSILVTAVCLLACSVREGAGNAINLTEVKNTLESTSHVLGQMQQALQEMSHVEKKDMGNKSF